MKKIYASVLICFILNTISWCQTATNVYYQTKKKIIDCVDNKDNSYVGIAIIDLNSTHYFIYSSPEKKLNQEFSVNSIFRADKVYDIFKDFYFSEVILNSSIDFNLPIQEYLPKNSKTVAKITKKVTLADMITNTSGLSCNPTSDSTGQIDKLLERCIIDYTSGNFYEKNVTIDLISKFIIERVTGIKEEESIIKEIKKINLNHTTISSNKGVTDNNEPQVTTSLKDLSKIVAVELGVFEKQLNQGLINLRKIEKKSELSNIAYTSSWVRTEFSGNSLYIVEFQQNNFHFFIGMNPSKKRGVVTISDIKPVSEIAYSILTDLPINNQPSNTNEEELQNITGEYYNDFLEVVSVFKEHDRLYAHIGKTGIYELFHSGGNEYYTIIPEFNLHFISANEKKEQSLVIQNGKEFRKK